MTPRVPVSWGELIDKITILRIKAQRLREESRRANVRRELALLEAARDEAAPLPAGLAPLAAELEAVNERLWQTEDAIRACEARGDFGPDFVALARSVYLDNDQRAALKRRISSLMGSELVEEKAYAPYRPRGGGEGGG